MAGFNPVALTLEQSRARIYDEYVKLLPKHQRQLAEDEVHRANRTCQLFWRDMQ